MSMAFDGSTSTLASSTLSTVLAITGNPITYVMWAYARTTGEGGVGTLMQTGAGQTRPMIGYVSSDVLRIIHGFGTQNGLWTFPAKVGQWNPIAVAYDRGNVANDPIVRVGFTNVTVTETQAPIGVINAPANAYRIGATNAGASSWDGFVAHLQMFIVLLSPWEMDQALKRPGSIRRGIVTWNPLATPTDLTDRIQQAVLTPTAITQGPPPPVLAWQPHIL